MLTARRFLVSGRVQGVGFRFFVEDAARREGLGGWVKNLGPSAVMCQQSSIRTPNLPGM